MHHHAMILQLLKYFHNNCAIYSSIHAIDLTNKDYSLSRCVKLHNNSFHNMLKSYLVWLISHVYAGDCQKDWPTHGKFCYKVFEGGSWGKSWNEAESYCNTFGGDLVDIQDEQEQSFVYSLLNWNQNSGSYRFYWLGLNDLVKQGQLEWVNTDQNTNKNYNYDFFAVDGNQYDQSSRCTFALFSNNLPDGFGDEGKWSKAHCQNRYSFVCKIVQGHAVQDCQGDSWDLMDVGYTKSCITLKKQNKPFELMVSQCEDYGSNPIFIEK